MIVIILSSAGKIADRILQSGLYAILGDPNSKNPRGTPSELAIHARIFYYAQRVGVHVDFAQYKAWLAENPQHIAPDVLPEAYKALDSEPSNVPAWQASAPKTELYVEKNTAPGKEVPQGGDQPAYPMGFAEMLDRIQKGLPIPGIKDIPDTVVRDPVSLTQPTADLMSSLTWERPSNLSVLDLPQENHGRKTTLLVPTVNPIWTLAFLH